MILTFSELKFELRIINGIKGTTFREDKHDRWKVGITANLWMHNPRNVKLNPHHIKDDVICDIDYVLLIPVKDTIRFYNEYYTKRSKTYSVSRSKRHIDRTARVDGFDNWEDMKQWFIKRGYTDPKGYRMKRLFFKSWYYDDLPF